MDAISDLDCMILRNHYGVWCGYVGVPPSHPLHGKDYDQLPDFVVHGGVTFSNMCHEGAGIDAICHVPEPGREPDVWWIGFDCGHAWDLSPVFISKGIDMLNEGSTYRTKDYAMHECFVLAQQLCFYEYSRRDDDGRNEEGDRPRPD